MDLAVKFNSAISDNAIRLAVSYIQQAEFIQTGSAVDYALNIDEIKANLRNGVSPSAVYERPMSTVRMALADGRSLSEAIALGRDRLAVIADTDAMLAGRAGASRAMAESKRIEYYYRHPDPLACDFCLLVSTRRYKVKNLMPVHQQCHCTVIPLASRQKITVPEPETLMPKDVKVREHGELGPVVVNSRHAFKGPNDLNG